MSGRGITWVHIPMLERLALAELSFRRRKSEEETLAEIIRQAVIQELQKYANEEQNDKGGNYAN